jgi:cytochrome P450
MLLAARDEETVLGISDVQLRDEVMTMLLAGHETTNFSFHRHKSHLSAQC